jgi:hypothetical protein
MAMQRKVLRQLEVWKVFFGVVVGSVNFPPLKECLTVNQIKKVIRQTTMNHHST